VDTPVRCPFCSSEKVYRLLNTLRCKRCKNIWKEGEDDRYSCDPCGSPALTRERQSVPLKKTETLEARQKKAMDEHLKKNRGKFCMDTIGWKTGDISQALFRQYLKKNVKKGILKERKDRYGRTWYSRPG
jgi:DNA-directed RNA polymerase subunit RPC12/RpoP